MVDIRRVGVVINEAERLRRKSSTKFKAKFLPEYSFNCCKNVKRCCRNYPTSTCVKIMQKIHGLTPFWGVRKWVVIKSLMHDKFSNVNISMSTHAIDMCNTSFESSF